MCLDTTRKEQPARYVYLLTLMQAVWSYNQGVIVGALVELHRALSSSAPVDAYLTIATNIALAALDQLSDENGVIHDGCEFAPEGCGPDASQFKGIFMRNLQRLHAVAPDDAFEKAIRSNAESIWEYNRKGGCKGYGARGALFSINWAGPFEWSATATTHSSAMDALVAAVAIA
jgi:predicted alpha-1,6-mannanase (GH76 family)